MATGGERKGGEERGVFAWGMEHEFKSEDVSVRSERMSVSGDGFEWVWGDGVERERYGWVWQA